MDDNPLTQAVSTGTGSQAQRARSVRQAGMNPVERLDHMIKLRETLGLGIESWQISNPTAIGHCSTPVIRRLIAEGKRLDDWPLIIACCQEYEKRLKGMTRYKGKRIDSLRLLSNTYQQLGLFAEAENCLARGMLEQDQGQPLIRDYRQCLQIARRLPVGSEALCSDELLLTPLRPCHENGFFWQYSADIAEWCKLPDFDDDDEKDWCQWLADYQQQPVSNLFAINHRDWGFIGSVGIDIAKDIGFIFYWVGADFQGYGFAPQAVALLLNWADCYKGLRCCYAVAYEDNKPSEKVLQKLDFRPVPLKIEDDYGEEYAQEYAYYRGPYKEDRLLLFELNQFFIDIDSELRVVAFAASSESD